MQDVVIDCKVGSSSIQYQADGEILQAMLVSCLNVLCILPWSLGSFVTEDSSAPGDRALGFWIDPAGSVGRSNGVLRRLGCRLHEFIGASLEVLSLVWTKTYASG